LVALDVATSLGLQDRVSRDALACGLSRSEEAILALGKLEKTVRDHGHT
jgi:hypothetical protein